MTQINSGLGTSKVTADTVNGYVRITVVAGSQPVTQYYVAKPDDPTIYMATYITGEVSPGELRFLDIPRIVRDVLANHHFSARPTLAELASLDRWARQEVVRWTSTQTCRITK